MQPAPAQSLGKVAARGTFWTYVAFLSGKLLTFLTTVVLARLLIKEDFGIAAYALVVINFLDVFSEFGLGPALIYHRETPGSANTAFWSGIGTSIIIFGIAWFGAPFVSLFFNDERAVAVTRMLALTFPISALGNIHDALLRKELSFGRRFLPLITQSLGKGGASIGLAFFGMGAWSLIIGQVAGTALSVIVFWAVCPWRPSFHFARSTARSLLTYGLSTVLVNLLAAWVLNVDYLFVGRFLGPALLGVYTIAFRIPQLLIIQICDPISKVIFPMYAKMKDDPDALQRGFLTTLHYVSLVTLPLGIGLVVLARPFILFVYGEQWIEAIPVMQAITVYAMMLSLAYNTGDVHKAQGRMLLMTKIHVFRLLLMLPGFWWATTALHDITAVGLVHVAVACVALIVNLVIIARLYHIPARKFFVVLRSSVVGSALMGGVMTLTLVAVNEMRPIEQLLICGVIGGAIYLASLWWLERTMVLQGLRMARSLLLRLHARQVRQPA